MKKSVSGFATLRRELTDFGYMHKNPCTSEYWAIRRVLRMKSAEDNIRKRSIPRSTQSPTKKTVNSPQNCRERLLRLRRSKRLPGRPDLR